MQATPELLEKWEPKVHWMLRLVPAGQEYEDFCQELRIEIIRAAGNFQEGRGASFHTFLHACMLNRIRQLMNARKKSPEIDQHHWIDSQPDEEAGAGNLLASPSIDVPDEPENFFHLELWSAVKPTAGESLLMDLLLCGYKFAEIQRASVDPKKTTLVLKNLQKKLQAAGITRNF